jgi:hypothetical protein
LLIVDLAGTVLATSPLRVTMREYLYLGVK